MLASRGVKRYTSSIIKQVRSSIRKAPKGDGLRAGILVSTAVLLPGAAAGAVFGWRDARADQGRYERAQEVWRNAQTEAQARNHDLETYLGKQPRACRNALRVYIASEAAEQTDQGTTRGDLATLIVDSDLCSDGPRALAAASKLATAATQAANSLEIAATDVEAKRHDADYNYELFQAAGLGMGTMVVIAGIATTFTESSSPRRLSLSSLWNR